MKLWKSSILFVSVTVMLLSSMAVSADKTESDPTGDVWHWNYADTAWGWDTNVGSMPNIDVTEVSYTVSGTQVTLTLKVDGTISSSELIYYYVYLNTSDSTYMLAWGNGTGFGFGTNTEEGSDQGDYNPEITASGNTISATFDVIGTFTSGVEVYGWASEYTESGDATVEWWADWAPETYSPYWEEGGDGDDDDDEDGDGDGDDGNGGSSGSSGTPGFEAIAVLAAVGIALIILRRRK